MPVEYRLLKTEEMEQIFDLWAAVYPETQREAWKQEFLSIPGSLEHTFVAVDGGRVLAAALVWVREMNDAAGRAQRVGNVSHVATHPAARRQGHARRLLERVIAHLEQAACDFSTLFTSEEGQPLYERLGWQTCPTFYWEGRLAGGGIPRSTDYITRPAVEMDDPSVWQALAVIYTEFNKTRPFAIRRDGATWNRFTAYKITDWVQAGATVWLAAPSQAPQAVCGYLIAHSTAEGFLIAELGVKEGHRAAVPNLLYAVTGAFAAGQPVGGRIYLPDEPDIQTHLRQCLDPLVKVQSNELMVRPVNPRKDLSSFMRPNREPAGMVWILDQL